MNLSKISKSILSDIDEFCVAEFSDGHRTHLGASIIGHECSYYLWLTFRWCFKERFSGRMLRLFNRGHLEELRVIRWLEGIGCIVETDDFSEKQLWYNQDSGEYVVSENDTSDCECMINVSESPAHIHHAKSIGIQIPQFKISGVNGHFGGSMDGLVWLPERFGIDEPVILECKTSKAGAYFNKLKGGGVLLNNSQHFDQQSTYGYKKDIRYALYIAVNKNDDDLHAELIELDHSRGAQCEQKADRIINSKEAPYKLSSSKTFHKCSYCPARSVCHEGAIPEKNCRSCIHSTPVENKKWQCDKWSVDIPSEHIGLGCDSWQPITQQ